MVALGSTAILALGTAQVAKFYLLSGAYFWIVYLSFGLYLFVFLLPWLNLILPYRRNFHSKSMFLFNMSTGDTATMDYCTKYCSKYYLFG